MKRREFLQDAGLPATALLLGGPGCRSLRSPTANGLNVALILSDTLRADHVGCYGAPRCLTPNVDALAGRGCGLRAVLSAIVTDAPLAQSPPANAACTDRGICLHRCRALGADGVWEESELKGIIAFLLLRFLLNHGARADFDNGHWDHRAILEKELSHP